MKLTSKINLSLLAVTFIAVLIPCVALSQSDGGKKKKKPKTEQRAQAKKKPAPKPAPAKKPATKGYKPLSHTDESKISNPTSYKNGHGYVDLGLPSGIFWATCNIGASRPSDYGDYYAWGEINTKSEYYESNSYTHNKTLSQLKSKDYIDRYNILAKKFDVARNKWGDTWRLPTSKECEELKMYCKWQKVKIEGTNGYKIVGPNGNSIFIPFAGEIGIWGEYDKEKEFYIWSSSVGTSYDTIRLYSQDSFVIIKQTAARNLGLSIRPVCSMYL